MIVVCLRLDSRTPAKIPGQGPNRQGHDPLKNWKFQVGDLEERKRWDEYTEAYEDVLERTSTEWGPWYIVPADRKKSRDLAVAQVVVAALDRMAPQFPRVDPEVLKIARQWERETTAQRRIEE